MKPFTKAYISSLVCILLCGFFHEIGLPCIAGAFGVVAFIVLITAGFVLEDEK